MESRMDIPPVDNESSYKILIDKNEFNANGRPPADRNQGERGSRTRALLSGGYRKPTGMNGMNNGGMNNAGMNGMNAGQAYFSGATPYDMNRPPMQPMHQQPNRMGFAPPPRQGPLDGRSSMYYPGAGGNPYYAAPLPPQRGDLFNQPAPRRHHRRHHRRHRKQPWYKAASGSESSSESDSSSSENANWWKKREVSRSRSRSRSSISGSRKDRYGLSESGRSASSSAAQSDQGLNTLQKRMVLNTIREYCPENMHNVVYEDLISQMELFEKKGFTLPKGYDKRKHEMGENEIKLYEQQLQRDKSRDQKKMTYMINFAALGLSWFCQFISVDWIKTKHLPSLIRSALDEGEFEDSIEGIGQYLRGSVFDNPMFSTILKFVEKIGESHHKEMEEELDKLEDQADDKEKRHNAALNKLNRFRQSEPKVQLAQPKSVSSNQSTTKTFDVPPPGSSSSTPKKTN